MEISILHIYIFRECLMKSVHAVLNTLSWLEQAFFFSGVSDIFIQTLICWCLGIIFQNVVLQNFIFNTVSDWFNDKELTNGSFRYKEGNDYGKGLNNLDLYSFMRRRNLQE